MTTLTSWGSRNDIALRMSLQIDDVHGAALKIYTKIVKIYFLGISCILY